MLTTALAREVDHGRAAPARFALLAAGGCALLALVDPVDGPYPVCPTRALLGVDCPACGTLRGLHAASRGQLGAALSHNLLLALAIPLGAIMWLGWVRAALGRPALRRPAPWLHRPAWLVPAVLVVATAFAIARNLPVDGLAWLDSA